MTTSQEFPMGLRLAANSKAATLRKPTTLSTLDRICIVVIAIAWTVAGALIVLYIAA